MEKIVKIFCLDSKGYAVSVLNMDNPKAQIKLNKAEADMVTTERERLKFAQAYSFHFIFEYESDVNYAIFLERCHHFITLCLIQKLSIAQSNVLLAHERGFSGKQMMDEIGVDESTVYWHHSNIKEHFGVKSLAEARFIITNKKANESFF